MTSVVFAILELLGKATTAPTVAHEWTVSRMDDDFCYECTGYGDDYFINDDGELECYCPQCPFNPDCDREDDW